MNSTQSDSEVRDPDRADGPAVHGGDTETHLVAAGDVARDLLAIRTPADVEARVLASIRECSRAQWAALYRPMDDTYTISTLSGAPPQKLPTHLPAERVDGICAPGEDLRRCVGPRVRSLLCGAHFFAAIASEFDHRPLLLLIGGCEVEDGEADRLRIMGAVCDVSAMALRNADLIDRLRSQVFVDFVTGLFNRRAFEEHLTVEFVRARRYDRPLSILLLDLDGFKGVNDSLGHAVGDQVLRQIAEVLGNAFRTTDRVCRFGGDEFAVIFPETSKQDVVRLAERLRRQIASGFPNPVTDHTVTASIGVASFPRDAADLDSLVAIADRALYRAKSEGRNQVAAA